MINGQALAETEPAPKEVNDAVGFLVRTVALVILLTAIPLQVALWRWAV